MIQQPVLKSTKREVALRLEVVPAVGLQFRRAELAPLQGWEVEIAPEWSFVSAGTELNILEKGLAQEPRDRDMTSAGHVLGYSQSGIVQRVGSDVYDVAPGDRVVAIGAGAYHASRTVVAKNLVLPLGESTSSKVASMMAMLCFSLEGVYKANTRIGQNVVVLGAGMMGQITARLFHLSGCRVFVLDSNVARLALLPEGIAGFSLSPEGWEALGCEVGKHGVEVASICFGGDATESIERLKGLMSRSPDGIPHGKIIFPGGAKVTVLMASNMGNIQLISSAKAGPGYRDPSYEAGYDYPAGYVRSTVRRNMETLLRLIDSGQLGDLECLITHHFLFSEAHKAYDLLRKPGTLALGVLLAYEEDALLSLSRTA